MLGTGGIRPTVCGLVLERPLSKYARPRFLKPVGFRKGAQAIGDRIPSLAAQLKRKYERGPPVGDQGQRCRVSRPRGGDVVEKVGRMAAWSETAGGPHGLSTSR